MDSEIISIGETARTLGVSIDTIRRWEREGLLKSFRPSPKSHRYFRKKDIDAFIARTDPHQETDLFRLAYAWTIAKSPNGLPASLYCETSDVFNARLDRFGQEMSGLRDLKELYPLVVAVAGEIGNNSFNHNLGNWPDVPGAFFGYDIQAGRVVLADRGQGIFRTLKRAIPDLKDDQEALHAAFTRYISGRAPENRGNGLKFVKDVISANPLSLDFYTGGAGLALSRQDGQIKEQRPETPVRGCLAELTFSRKGS